MALIKTIAGNTPDISKAAFVAENATIIGNVRLERGSSVWYGAVVRGDNCHIEIGEGSNVQDCAVLHTDKNNGVVIGRNVTIGHSAIVHGCTVEDGALIGMHATVLNGAVIGAGAVVGAGALVTEGMIVPAGAVVMGVPAKVRGQVSEELAAYSSKNAELYTWEAGVHAGASEDM